MLYAAENINGIVNMGQRLLGDPVCNSRQKEDIAGGRSVVGDGAMISRVGLAVPTENGSRTQLSSQAQAERKAVRNAGDLL
jgi:hypothetical protein